MRSFCWVGLSVCCNQNWRRWRPFLMTWLMPKDNVMETSGLPTGSSLCTALQEIYQKWLAAQIECEHACFAIVILAFVSMCTVFFVTKLYALLLSYIALFTSYFTHICTCSLVPKPLPWNITGEGLICDVTGNMSRFNERRQRNHKPPCRVRLNFFTTWYAESSMLASRICKLVM